MAPKKRRQANTNNKENTDSPATNLQLDSISIQSIINEHLTHFEVDFQKECQKYESDIQEKLSLAHREFDKYLQTHESQARLARLLEQEISRISQQQVNSATAARCQDLLDKTTDLMNASASESSRTKSYLIGELQALPHGNK